MNDLISLKNDFNVFVKLMNEKFDRLIKSSRVPHMSVTQVAECLGFEKCPLSLHRVLDYEYKPDDKRVSRSISDFECQLFEHYFSRAQRIDCSSVSDFKNKFESVLLDLDVNEVVFSQPKIQVPESFVRNNEITRYAFKSIIPDFIHLMRDKNVITIKVLDAKVSSYNRVFDNYKIQLTLYYEIVGEFIKMINTRGYDVKMDIDGSGVLLGYKKRTIELLGSRCFMVHNELCDLLKKQIPECIDDTARCVCRDHKHEDTIDTLINSLKNMNM